MKRNSSYVNTGDMNSGTTKKATLDTTPRIASDYNSLNSGSSLSSSLSSSSSSSLSSSPSSSSSSSSSSQISELALLPSLSIVPTLGSSNSGSIVSWSSSSSSLLSSLLSSDPFFNPSLSSSSSSSSSSSQAGELALLPSYQTALTPASNVSNKVTLVDSNLNELNQLAQSGVHLDSSTLYSVIKNASYVEIRPNEVVPTYKALVLLATLFAKSKELITLDIYSLNSNPNSLNSNPDIPSIFEVCSADVHNDDDAEQNLSDQSIFFSIFSQSETLRNLNMSGHERVIQINIEIAQYLARMNLTHLNISFCQLSEELDVLKTLLLSPTIKVLQINRIHDFSLEMAEVIANSKVLTGINLPYVFNACTYDKLKEVAQILLKSPSIVQFGLKCDDTYHDNSHENYNKGRKIVEKIFKDHNDSIASILSLLDLWCPNVIKNIIVDYSSVVIGECDENGNFIEFQG